MKCDNCGKRLNISEHICPYCGTDQRLVDRAIKSRKLEKDLDIIDALVFGNLSINQIYEQNSETLEIAIQTLESKFSTSLPNEEIINKLNNLEQAFQSQLAVKPSVVQTDAQYNAFQTTGDAIKFLSQTNPPQVNLMAYKIRNAIEKMLKDHYKLPYCNLNGKYMFAKKVMGMNNCILFDNFWERYDIATKDTEISKALNNQYGLLNKFIHDHSSNDTKIKQKYPKIEDQVKYLLDTYEMFKKYNLIWE